jgi:hypothetical protein
VQRVLTRQHSRGSGAQVGGENSLAQCRTAVGATPQDSGCGEQSPWDSDLCGTKSRLDSRPLALPPPPPPKPPKQPRKKAPKRRAAPPKPPPKKRQRQEQRWEIDAIVEESGRWGGHSRWFLVRWAGYHPDWERLRVRGAVGSPVETWEPLRTMARTQALIDWDAAKEEA